MEGRVRAVTPALASGAAHSSAGIATMFAGHIGVALAAGRVEPR